VSHTAAYDADPARWSRAWQHRERLLRIARRRTMSEQEAEDAVSEVLLRASEGAITDDDAFARWLTSVTLNVCADIAREHSMSGKHAVYSVRQLMPVPSPEQVVVDRETAATAVHRLSRLPDRQREALLLRSAGFGVDEIAEHLDVSYKTAESLLSRARAFMRKTVAVLLAIFVGLGRLLRRPAKTAPAFAVAALTIAVGIVPNAGADRPHWVQLRSGPHCESRGPSSTGGLGQLAASVDKGSPQCPLDSARRAVRASSDAGAAGEARKQAGGRANAGRQLRARRGDPVANDSSMLGQSPAEHHRDRLPALEAISKDDAHFSDKRA
jgi:RNA polymerase sigma factor (sigma-70 family)